MAPLSPLLIRSSSSTKVVSSWPLALAGAVTGSRPKILNWVNWTPTLLLVSGIRSADTCSRIIQACVLLDCKQDYDQVVAARRHAHTQHMDGISYTELKKGHDSWFLALPFGASAYSICMYDC